MGDGFEGNASWRSTVEVLTAQRHTAVNFTSAETEFGAPIYLQIARRCDPNAPPGAGYAAAVFGEPYDIWASTNREASWRVVSDAMPAPRTHTWTAVKATDGTRTLAYPDAEGYFDLLQGVLGSETIAFSLTRDGAVYTFDTSSFANSPARVNFAADACERQ